MSLAFGWSPWWLALALIATAAFVWWTYRQTTPPLPAARRWILGGLRFAALALAIVLLFGPVLRRVEAERKAPVLAVLVDASESLGLRADSTRPSAAATAREWVRALPTALGRDVDVRLVPFAAEPGADLAAPESLRFDGARTDIARAMRHVTETMRDEPVRGVLLVSDGRYNAGRNPLHVADRFPVPVYTAVVGDTTAQRDVQVHRVTTNELGYVGRALPVRASLRADGYAGERVRVELVHDGRVVAAETVRLDDDADATVDFRYSPSTPGLTRLQVRATALPGELTLRNNARDVAVRVLERRRTILLLAGAPGPDVAALRGILEADPDADVATRVQRAPGRYYEGDLPASFDAFDAVVLAGFPGAATPAADVRRVRAAVEAGLPVLFVLTRATDVAALGRAFGTLLPAAPESVRPGFAPARVQLRPGASSHAVLDGLGDGWERLPPLSFNASRWRASPDARVLATAEVRGVALDDVLLAVRERAGQRSAAVLGADTWRWRNLPRDLQDVETRWPMLVTNLLQWVLARPDERTVRVAPTADAFDTAEPVTFDGQVYDERLVPVADARVEVDVVDESGARRPYVLDPLGDGRYVLDAGRLPPGTYRYAARAERDGARLGEDRGSFTVGALTLEYRDTQADAALMRGIAARSGGAVLEGAPADALHTLLSGADFTPIVQERVRETELHRRWLLLAAVLVLLTAEWVLRKRSGMV